RKTSPPPAPPDMATRFRPAWVVCAATLLGMGAWVGYGAHDADRTRDLIKTMAASSDRCGKLTLGMTRDEVIRVMGPPAKQYAVRPDGKSGDVQVLEMLYPMPAG